MEYEIAGEPPAICADASARGRRPVAQRPRDAAVRPRRPAGRDAGGAVHRPASVRDGVRAARRRAGCRRAARRAHARTTCRHASSSRGARAGAARLTRSFLTLDTSAGDIVLSALKQAEDRASVIVRLFNPGDRGGARDAQDGCASSTGVRGEFPGRASARDRGGERRDRAAAEAAPDPDDRDRAHKDWQPGVVSRLLSSRTSGESGVAGAIEESRSLVDEGPRRIPSNFSCGQASLTSSISQLNRCDAESYPADTEMKGPR